MARTQATSTINPTRLALGQRIVFEDALAVVQQQNHTFGNRPQVHLACVTAPSGWSTNSPHTLRVTFEGTDTNTMRTELQTFVRIDPDVVNIVLGIRTVFSGGDTGSVRITVGGTSHTFTCSAANNGVEQTQTLATSSTGTDWQTVLVELERTGGTTAAYLRNIRIQDEQITSSLPGPVND